MEILDIWFNEEENEKKILVKKGDNYYLLKEYAIGGTFYRNWSIFEDYANNLEVLEDNNTSESDLHNVGGDYTSLYDCMFDLMYMEV